MIGYYLTNIVVFRYIYILSKSYFHFQQLTIDQIKMFYRQIECD